MNYCIAAIVLYVLVVLAYRAFRRPGMYRLENMGMSMSAIVISLLMQSSFQSLSYARTIADLLIIALLLCSIRSTDSKRKVV